MAYRAYFFGNFYLSSIQQGIQAAHVIGNMAYTCVDDEDFLTWAGDDKTIICLNGGDQKALHKIVDFFSLYASDYSWHYFNESADALNASITSVGIILPEHIWKFDEDTSWLEDKKSFSAQMKRLIQKCPLAR